MKILSSALVLLFMTTTSYAQSAPKPAAVSAPSSVAPLAPAPAPAPAPAGAPTGVAPAQPSGASQASPSQASQIPSSAVAATRAPSCADSAVATQDAAEFKKLLDCHLTLGRSYEQLGQQIDKMPKGTYENSIALMDRMMLALDLLKVDQAIQESGDNLYPSTKRPSVPKNVQPADDGKAPVIQTGVAENTSRPE